MTLFCLLLPLINCTLSLLIESSDFASINVLSSGRGTRTIILNATVDDIALENEEKFILKFETAIPDFTNDQFINAIERHGEFLRTNASVIIKDSNGM